MKTIASWSRMVLAVVSLSVAAFAQTASDLGEGLRAEITGTAGVTAIKWWGKPGRTYFLQSCATLDRAEWVYTPVLEMGSDALLSWNLQTTAERMFVRLVYTDQPVAGSAAAADFDGDGTSNAAELAAGSSPFLRDSDWDGYTDSAEIAAGSDPSSGGSDPGTDPEPTGPLNPDSRYQNGLRLDYAYKFLDFEYRKTQNGPGTSPVIFSDGIVKHGYGTPLIISDPSPSSSTNLEEDLLSAYLDTPFNPAEMSLYQYSSYGIYIESWKTHQYTEGVQGAYSIRDRQLRYRYEVQAIPSPGAYSGAQRAMLLILYKDGFAESNIKEVGSVTFSQHNVSCTDSIARHCQVLGNKVVIETNLEEEVPDIDPSSRITYQRQDYHLLIQPINLDIYNGQGALTPAARKYDVGAFTVANLNDTDADGTPDNVDTDVPGEKDLMKLYIGGYTGKSGSIKIRVKTGSVKFWESETKGTSIPLQGGAATFPIPSGGTGISKTIWVEATAASNKVRDIELEEIWVDGTGKEHPPTDKVRATAVWVTAIDFKNQNNQYLWDEASSELKSFAFSTETTPFGIKFDLGNYAGKQCIGFKFKVQPAGLSKEPNVHFDLGRQLKARYWIKNQDGWVQDVGEGQVVDWPTGDVCNDDAKQTDEDVVPTKDFLFSIDGPGLAIRAAEIAPEISGQHNFKEFARVTFDGSKPKGNNDDGSRCSDKLDWQSFYWWRSTPSLLVPGRMVYKVSPDATAGFNKIGLGHGTIQSP